jgi:hypothetical protein
MLGVFGLSDMPPFYCDHRVKKMAKKTLEQKPVGRICENRCEPPRSERISLYIGKSV